jgi:hypothetical protein
MREGGREERRKERRKEGGRQALLSPLLLNMELILLVGRDPHSFHSFSTCRP